MYVCVMRGEVEITLSQYGALTLPLTPMLSRVTHMHGRGDLGPDMLCVVACGLGATLSFASHNIEGHHLSHLCMPY